MLWPFCILSGNEADKQNIMITLLLALGMGVMGTIQVQDHGKLQALQQNHSALVERVDNHDYELAKHGRALNYLHSRQEGPKTCPIPTDASWMEKLQ